MRQRSRYRAIRRLAAAAPGTAALVLCLLHTAQAATASEGRWQVRGAGIAAEAVWSGQDGEPRLWLRCDHGDPVLVLRIAPSQLPGAAGQLTLQADGTAMDYPATPTGDHGLTSRIALDAPILDRMLVAHRFAVSVRGQALATGSPAEPLARVVRACRALHWPREARIERNDAGLANR